MNGKTETIYLDACIFLAHLKNETRQDPRDMAGVEELTQKIDRLEVNLVTSVITLSEVLESGVPVNARDTFLRLFQRRHCHLIDVTARIAEIAHNIRDYYRKQQAIDGLPTVATPDALHLATAIEVECDVFYTFDEKDDPKRKRGLIPLNPVVAGQYSLSIKKPAPTGAIDMPLFPLPPPQKK